MILLSSDQYQNLSKNKLMKSNTNSLISERERILLCLLLFFFEEESIFVTTFSFDSKHRSIFPFQKKEIFFFAQKTTQKINRSFF